MSEFFEYDPINGITYSTDYDEATGETVVHSMQDVDPILDHVARIRNKNDDSGIKRDIWKYCTIPAAVELILLEKGINIHNKDHWPDVLREINTNYPKLKYTNLHHE